MSDSLAKRFLFLLTCAVPLALTGCQTTFWRDYHLFTPQAEAAPIAPLQNPLTAFVSTAAPGERAMVSDAEFGEAQVTMEREYFSASGQSCRRFTVRPGNLRAAAETRVMCQNANSEWALVRLPVAVR